MRGNFLKRRGFISAIAVVAVASALVTAAPARADHEDGSYSQPAYSQWESAVLDVLIVPPNHGEIFTEENGFLNGNDPNELTPNNSYLKAMEAAVAAWDQAVQSFGSESLRGRFTTNVYVLGRDAVPPDALRDLEILVVTDEEHGLTIGTAYRAHPAGCVARISKFSLISFTYADMYNITGHEYGHCLGLGHVGDQGGVDPTSEMKHPEHDVMNGFYTHWIGFRGTHLHCVSNMNVAGLEWVFTHPPTIVPVFGAQLGRVEMPVERYGTTCEPPPPPPAPAPPAEPSPSPEPEPAGSPSSEGPPPPAEEPQEQPLHHSHSVSLSLRRHLIARGEVIGHDGFSGCFSGVTVEILKKNGTSWVAQKSAVTNASGSFRVRLRDARGSYAARMVAFETDDGAHICDGATSPVVRHRH